MHARLKPNPTFHPYHRPTIPHSCWRRRPRRTRWRRRERRRPTARRSWRGRWVCLCSFCVGRCLWLDESAMDILLHSFHTVIHAITTTITTIEIDDRLAAGGCGEGEGGAPGAAGRGELSVWSCVPCNIITSHTHTHTNFEPHRSPPSAAPCRRSWARPTPSPPPPPPRPPTPAPAAAVAAARARRPS